MSLLEAIYNKFTMRIQVGQEPSTSIQLDTGTVQGSLYCSCVLSPLLFDLFINALLRLLDSTGISHRVKGIPDWNHQAFANDLSLYVENTADANELLRIMAEFEEWSGLRISIKTSLVTGALYGQEEVVRNAAARKESSHRKATGKKEREPTLEETQIRAVIDSESTLEEILSIQAALSDIKTINSSKRTCDTCGHKKEPHQFKRATENKCSQCCHTWADVQRRKITDKAVEVLLYLYKNDTLRIDQSLRLIGMCFPFQP